MRDMIHIMDTLAIPNFKAEIPLAQIIQRVDRRLATVAPNVVVMLFEAIYHGSVLLVGQKLGQKLFFLSALRSNLDPELVNRKLCVDKPQTGGKW
jgi:hypothetical protein